MIVIISKGMRPGDRLFCHKQNYLYSSAELNSNLCKLMI
jgi:hypothetical protein